MKHLGWYSANSGNRARAVAQFRPNQLGLYDMSGNVREWCQDLHDDYPSGAQTNPRGPDAGSHRVVRGGSWGYSPADARTAYRSYWYPDDRNVLLGFRLARAVKF